PRGALPLRRPGRLRALRARLHRSVPQVRHAGSRRRRGRRRRGRVTTSFDPDALRARYRAERDKRLRADGNDQYVEVAGDFAHYVDDPYVAPGFARAPIADEVEVLVIGG